MAGNMSVSRLAYASGRASGSSQASGLSFSGIGLLVIGLLVLGSGFVVFRPMIAGMLVHPYLILLAVVAPWVLLSRIYDFPLRPLVAMSVFFTLFVISSFDPVSQSFVANLAAGLLSIVFVALVVRSRADFVAGVVGLTLAVGILGYRGVVAEEEGGGRVQVVERANKNNFSLYALPAMLLAGHVVTRYKSTPKVLKAILLLSVFGMLTAIFMSANRSGYLGCVVVGVLVFYERRFRGLILVGIVTFLLVYWLRHFGSTAAFEERWNATQEGVESDRERWELFKAALHTGLSNPALGVSQGGLSVHLDQELREHIGISGGGAHNVIGAVVGGSGLFCFAALVYLGWSLWFWPIPGRPGQPPPAEFIEARLLLRCMMVLWLVRGQFTDEILYAPGFCIGLGLAIGLCIAADRAARQAPAFASPLLPLGTRVA